MRRPVYVVICILLNGCGGGASYQQAENSGNLASSCIEQEARAVAPMKVDLETAAASVIARCSQYTEATRRDLQSRYPGYRDYMAPKLRELDQAYLDHARGAIAIARTSH